MAWLIAVVSIVCLHHSVSRQFNRCSFFMQLFATATVHPYYCSFGRYLHLQHTLRKRKNKKQQEMKRKKCLWKSQRPGCSFCPKMLGVHRQTFLPDEEAPASLPKHPRGAAPKSSPKRTTVQGTQHFYPNDSAQEFWNIIFRVWLKHVFPFLRPRGSVGREARGTKRERSESPPKRRFVRRTKWWQDRDILPTGQYEEKMCVCVCALLQVRSTDMSPKSQMPTTVWYILFAAKELLHHGDAFARQYGPGDGFSRTVCVFTSWMLSLFWSLCFSAVASQHGFSAHYWFCFVQIGGVSRLTCLYQEMRPTYMTHIMKHDRAAP